MTFRLVCIVASLATLAMFPSTSLATIDDDAVIILVRQDCTGIDDCFEHLGKSSSATPHVDTAEYWINGTRKPTASTPLLVDIGPGDWGGMHLSCIDDPFAGPPLGRNVEGHVTFRGAGQGTTAIIRGFGGLGTTFGTFQMSGDCDEISFESMTIQSFTYAFPFGAAVNWFGGGSSKWTNIELVSEGPRLWYDSCLTEAGEHYFFSSKLTLTVKGDDHSAFVQDCGKSWFFGSEISVFGTDETDANSLTTFTAFDLNGAQSVQLFGSLVRVIQGDASESVITGDTVYGVKIDGTASFHMHGGNMRVSASETTDAVGIDAGTSGTAHTPPNGFALDAVSGETTRLAGSLSNVRSPFLWPPTTEPPVDHSLTGADIFVETDCFASGDCSGGSESHLMVYTEDCPASDPWFDTVTTRCRNDTTDPAADQLADHEQRISDLEALHP